MATMNLEQMRKKLGKALQLKTSLKAGGHADDPVMLYGIIIPVPHGNGNGGGGGKGKLP